MTYTYKPRGTCARQMDFEVEDGIVKSLKVTGGCSGYSQGFSKLVVGMKIEDIIARVSGVDCNGKGTSCPDQFAKALSEI